MNHQMVTRRGVLVGGASLALVGCSAPSNNNSGVPYQSVTMPSWADVPLYLTMITVAAPVAAYLAGTASAVTGVIALARLAYVLKNVGVLADRASLIYDSIQFLNQLRSQRFALPALSSSPKPFIAIASGNINNFESVPVFKNDVVLQFGVLNEQGGSFGENDIYATVKRVDERPPQTVNEIWGSGDLPHAIVSPASNGNYDGKLPIGSLPPGAYVSYSWKVPRGQQPTDYFIANSAFVGPTFLSVDDANYSLDLASAIEAERNVEARFQLPTATLG